MKTLTKLLLLSTSITSTFAMEAAPAGVAADVAGAVHAGAAAPAAPYDDWMAEDYVRPAPAAAFLPDTAEMAFGLIGTLSEINQSLPATPWEDATIGFNAARQLSTLGMLAVNIDALDNGGALQPAIHTLPTDDQRALFMKRFEDIAARRNRDEMMTFITDAVARIPDILGDFLSNAIESKDISLRNYILTHITRNLDRMDADTRLKTYVHLGNIFPALQDEIVKGLARGNYGIEQNPAELRRLAYEEGWIGAQRVYAEGLAYGAYGIRKDRAELRRLAYEEGWVGAQEFYARGLAWGCYGIRKDHATLRALAIQNIRNNDSPYATIYFDTLETFREKIQFMVDAARAAELQTETPPVTPAATPKTCCTIM